MSAGPPLTLGVIFLLRRSCKRCATCAGADQTGKGGRVSNKQHVPFSELSQDVLALGSVPAATRRFLLENPFAAGRAQRFHFGGAVPRSNRNALRQWPVVLRNTEILLFIVLVPFACGIQQALLEPTPVTVFIAQSLASLRQPLINASCASSACAASGRSSRPVVTRRASASFFSTARAASVGATSSNDTLLGIRCRLHIEPCRVHACM
jgi:hypothetical protein